METALVSGFYSLRCAVYDGCEPFSGVGFWLRLGFSGCEVVEGDELRPRLELESEVESEGKGMRRVESLWARDSVLKLVLVLGAIADAAMVRLRRGVVVGEDSLRFILKLVVYGSLGDRS
jgi:hypothetical protein